MVDERDEHYEDQEEGEYHFSDDQVNYETDVEMPKAGTTATAINKANLKDVLLTKFNQNRRVVIGAVVFLVLIGIVYKLIMPSSSSVPSTDITAAAPETVATPPVKTAQLVKPTAPPPVEQQPAPPVNTQAAPPPAAVQSPVSMVAATAAPATPAQTSVIPPPAVVAAGAAPIANQQPLTPMQEAQAAAGINPAGGAVSTVPQPADAQSKNITDRLASLEQQNAAMMNLLQTEYAQKMSDYETQEMADRGKMEEITKRLNRMESALGQITQLLQADGGRPVASGMMNGSLQMGPAAVPTKAVEPRMTYSVQAIIPGRAWLKSDAGDTVTVAEGDVLRSYGRVTKIDPYDGIVNIDTGSKIITLSYGMNAE